MQRHLPLFFFGILLINISCNPSSKKENKTTLSFNEQKGSTVTIEIKNVEGAESIEFFAADGSGSFTSVPFENSTKIDLKEYISGSYYILVHKDSVIINTSLLLQGNDITIKATAEGKRLKIDTVINSPVYYEQKQIVNNFRKIKKTASLQKANTYLLDLIKDKTKNILLKDLSYLYIEVNKNNRTNLKALRAYARKQDSIIEKRIIQNTGIYNLNKLIDNTSINLDNFKFRNKTGQEAKIITHSDSLYIFDFWFIACKPCINDHKYLKPNLDKLKGANANIIGISVDKDHDIWLNYLKSNNYLWDNYIQLNNDKNSLSEYLNIYSYPTYITIDGDGKILFQGALKETLTFVESYH